MSHNEIYHLKDIFEKLVKKLNDLNISLKRIIVIIYVEIYN